MSPVVISAILSSFIFSAGDVTDTTDPIDLAGKCPHRQFLLAPHETPNLVGLDVFDRQTNDLFFHPLHAAIIASMMRLR